MRGFEFGTPFVETASGTARATATHAAVTGKTYYITDISGSMKGPGDSTIVVKQGTTTIWQDIIPSATTGTGNGVYIKNFDVPLKGASGALVSVTVGTATALSFANIAGYELDF